MKGILVAALALCLAAIGWLLAGRGGPEYRTVTRTVDRPAGPAPTGASAGATRDPSDADAALRARIVALEAELAAAKEKAAEVDSLDPLAFVFYSKRPMAWRVRKLLEIEPEKERVLLAWKLGQVLGEREGSGAEILEALRGEKDPRVVALLGEILRTGALSKSPPEVRRSFAELLRSSPTPEVRLAALRGTFMTEAFRGGFDERTKALAEEMNGLAVAALRTESSPEVIAAIANSFADWLPPPNAAEALRETAGRLPPGPARRAVWGAIARGTFLGDRGLSLVQEFRDATSQDARDDIAFGIARAGNSMGGGPAGTIEESRERFLVLYRGTSDSVVRRELARAAFHGLACLQPGELTDDTRADAAAFFRGVAAAEADTALRERLEKLAAAYEAKSAAYVDYDRILYDRK